MTLYSCRHDGDQYRITKFDADMNVESSYLTDGQDCDCPAGVRPMCRHREMLPAFIDRPAIGTAEMFDYDHGGWVLTSFEGEAEPMPSLPEGVTMIGLDDPALLHNTIAEAIGEPEAMLEPKPLPPAHKPSWRRI